MNEDRTDVSDETRQAEREESVAAHEPDRPPTPEEEQEADGRSVDPGVRTNYEEMIERGAEVRGEGQVS